MQYVFGAGQLFIQPLGADSLATGPMQIAALQGVSLDFAFSAKALHGDGAHWPFAVGRGTGKIPIKAEYARFTAAGFNAMLFGAADPLPVGMTRTAADEPHTVAGGAVAATHAADFMEDLGVTDAAEGLIYTKVSAAPVGLQYTCDDAGGYGFNSSRNGQPVLINYTYDHAASGYRLAVNNRNMGHTPRFSAVLTGTFNGKAMTLTLNSCTAGKLSLATKSEGFTIPSFSFAAAADDAGVVGTWSMEEGALDSEPAPADMESAWWEFEENDASTLFLDLTGYDNHLTATPDTATLSNASGLAGRAADRGAGTTSRLIYLPRASQGLDYGTGHSFTIGAWVYPTSLPSDSWSKAVAGRWAAPYNPGAAGLDGRVHTSYGLGIYNGLPFFEIVDSASGDMVAIGGSVSTNSWQLMVGVCDMSTHEMTLYVNGAEVATNTVSAGARAGGSVGANFIIGQPMHSDQTGGMDVENRQFVGRIDRVFSTDQAWSTADVQWLYNSAAGRSFADALARGIIGVPTP